MKKEIQYYDNESDNYKQNHFQLIYSLKIGDFLHCILPFIIQKEKAIMRNTGKIRLIRIMDCRML